MLQNNITLPLTPTVRLQPNPSCLAKCAVTRRLATTTASRPVRDARCVPYLSRPFFVCMSPDHRAEESVTATATSRSFGLASGIEWMEWLGQGRVKGRPLRGTTSEKLDVFTHTHMPANPDPAPVRGL